MHTLYLNDRPYPLPSRWEQLSRKQLITVAWLTNTTTDALTFAKLLFLAMTQSLPFWSMVRVRFFYFFQATVDERGDMISLTRSFIEHRSFTTQKIKKIGGKSVLFGPASGLSNITFWEYIRSEQLFLKYLDTNETVYLDKLIAVLYRPAFSGYDPQVHSDIRVPLVEAAVERRLKQVSRINMATKTAILMWYDSCRSHIISMFPSIFRKKQSELDQKLLKNQKPVSSSSGDWLDLITSLSADMTQFEKIGNTNLIVAFTDLRNRIRQNQKNQKR